MPTSHTSSPVCRPHFHSPLHWLGDAPKSLPHSSAWSPFACPQDPQDKVSHMQGPQTGSQHLFSFPPTPPKDSTPDSVQTGPAEYQVSLNLVLIFFVMII